MYTVPLASCVPSETLDLEFPFGLTKLHSDTHFNELQTLHLLYF